MAKTQQLLKLVAVLVVFTNLTQSHGQEPDTSDAQGLVTTFWQADGESQRDAASAALMTAASDAMLLHRWLKAGPEYSVDADVGEVENVRVGEDGTSFAYVFLIPESYDSARSYPVEFTLHGGVGRPKQEPGDSLWRSGYDALKKEDRIIVIPAAWRDAYWWQATQADNVPAILRELKRSYNVDENRVTLSGVSDGGTGAYFFAFKQPTQWAAFLPFIGHPGVLRNANSGGGYSLFFENLRDKPLYIVNGEIDRLYPAESVKPFIDILAQSGVTYTWKVIEGGGHNTQWLPEETPNIEAFKSANPRDPFPEQLQWVADRTDRYNRNHWIQVDERSRRDSPANLKVTRSENHFDVQASGVGEFTLLLSPDEIDFDQPVTVAVNDEGVFDALVVPDKSTLLKWARKDLDRTLLVVAELSIEVSQ